MLRFAHVLPLLALLTLLLPLGPARADEQDEEIRKMEVGLLGMTEFVGKTRLTEDGAKLLIEHMPSFEAIGEDDAFEETMDASYEKTGKYDFGAILKFEPYQKWVAATGVDAASWLRLRFRYLLVTTLEEMKADRAEMAEGFAEQMAQMEAMRSQMGEEAYQQMMAALEKAKGVVAAWDKVMKAIPVADEAEKKVLEKYGKALKKAEGEDDEEGEEDEDDVPEGEMR